MKDLIPKSEAIRRLREFGYPRRPAREIAAQLATVPCGVKMKVSARVLERLMEKVHRDAMKEPEVYTVTIRQSALDKI